jgi:hypothetical protein
MGAIIHCIFNKDPDELSEDEFAKLWNRAKYFSSLAYQIKWNG